MRQFRIVSISGSDVLDNDAALDVRQLQSEHPDWGRGAAIRVYELREELPDDREAGQLEVWVAAGDPTLEPGDLVQPAGSWTSNATALEISREEVCVTNTLRAADELKRASA